MWSSPQNSNNKNSNHYRSTDALLATSSDDFLLQSVENLVDASAAHTKCSSNENIAFRECDGKTVSATVECIRSNSATSLSSNSDITYTKKVHELCGSHQGTSNSSIKRKNSMKEIGIKSKFTSTQCSGSKLQTLTKEKKCVQSDDKDDESNQDDYPVNLDMLNEKCALLCDDIRKNCANRSSITDLPKRSHHLPRPPINYRFSAGDADKLEKGIKHSIPSTRSLKES